MTPDLPSAPQDHLTEEAKPTGLLTALVTSAMGLAFLLPFMLGVLAPFIVDDLKLSRSGLGLLVTVTYATGTVLSLLVGRLVDVLGARRMLIALLLFPSLNLAAFAAAPSYPWLVLFAGLGGFALAASNPVTNTLIAEHVPTVRRGLIMGIKQSGVQVVTFLAGAVLPLLALAVGWRRTVLLSAAVPLLVLVTALTFGMIPASSRVRSSQQGRSGPVPSAAAVRWLMGYVFLMGGGLAALTAYLPLYAYESLGLEEAASGALLALLGVTGIVSRIGWAHVGNRRKEPWPLLVLLAVIAAASGLLVWQSARAGAWLLWLGVIGIGASAVAQQSVSMLAAVREGGAGRTGQASGMVALGFFAGFIFSPILFGTIVDRTGSYALGWLLVVAQFGLGALLPLVRRRRRALADQVPERALVS